MPIEYQQYPLLSLEQRDALFSLYANNQGSILLDSSLQECSENAFDIIGVEPIAQYHNISDSVSDPLGHLREQFASYNVETCEIPEELNNLPCLGGLLFAFAYDLGRYYEMLPHESKDDLGLSDFYAGIYGCILVIDRNNEQSYLILSQNSKRPLYEKFNQQICALLEQQELEYFTEDFYLTSDWCSNFTKDEYKNSFQRIKDYIRAGDCYQVNLAQRFNAQCIGSSWSAYQQLAKVNKAPFSAYVNCGDATILSLSPERFISLKDSLVQTKPIKGTRPRGMTEQEDQRLRSELSHSKKDQAENLMIVDLMRNDLGRTCIPGSIKVPELFKIESFESVHHLVSTIIGTIEDSEDAFSLLANCFPGGSITGTPKIRAMNIIDELEPNRRSYYCGSIGYIDFRGQMDCNISIRTLVRKEDKIYCWAGGGIVQESIADDEYQETFDKVSRILPVLKRRSKTENDARIDYPFSSLVQLSSPIPSPPLRKWDDDLKASAVLLLLHKTDNEWQIIFTKRASHLNHHAGQVSFPGGRFDVSDEHLLATAIRETYEEIGISANHYKIIGQLKQRPTLTGFRIFPYIALLETLPPMTIAEDEVDEVFSAPLSFVCDSINHHKESIYYQGEDREYYKIQWRDQMIWGATARMLVDLSEYYQPQFQTFL